MKTVHLLSTGVSFRVRWGALIRSRGRGRSRAFGGGGRVGNRSRSRGRGGSWIGVTVRRGCRGRLIDRGRRGVVVTVVVHFVTILVKINRVGNRTGL